MRRRGWTRLEVRAAVEHAYTGEVQSMLQRTVYNVGGCTSYYLEDNGRNSTIWPWSTARLVRRVGAFDARLYDVR